MEAALEVPEVEKSAHVLTAAEILAADDLPTRDIPVPEWGGNVRVRGLSLASYQDIQREATVGGELDEGRLQVLMLGAAVVDEDGNQAFSPEQAQQLGEKSVVALGRVMLGIAELSGLEEGALAEAQRTFHEGL